MKRSVIRPLLAVVGSVALVTSFAGCGSDDKKDDAPATLSADEFKTQANKLCSDASADTESYGANISETSSDADVTAAVKKTVDRNKKLVSDIEDLKAPKDITDDVASMLDLVKEGLTQMGKLTSVADLKAFDPNAGVFKDANDKATALGLPDCAK